MTCGIRTTYHGRSIYSQKETWSAIDYDDYDVDFNGFSFVSSSPQGWGATEAEAIADLQQQQKEKAYVKGMVVQAIEG